MFLESGHIVVSVYRDKDNHCVFILNEDNESLSPITDILEDTLKLY